MTRWIAFATALLAASASFVTHACTELLPDHPAVIAASRNLQEAVVISEIDEPVLRLRLGTLRKGRPVPAAIPKRACAVPSFGAGMRVIVMEFDAGNLSVVPDRPSGHGR